MNSVRRAFDSGLRVLAAGTALILVAAACGGDDDDDAAAAATGGEPAVDAGVYAGPATDLAAGLSGLYDAALAAGEDEVVLVISDTGSELYGQLVTAFEAAYPEISVELKLTDFLQMGSIVQSELDAGQRTADVVTNAFLALKPLIDSGSLEDIDWSAVGVPDERVAEAPFVNLADGLCTTVVYNPDVIDEADLPETLEGFAEPEWRDLMATLPSNSVACMGFYSLMFGLEETEALASSLVDNGLIFTNDAEQLMLSGERPVLVFHYSLTAPRLEAQGAPVAEKLYPGTGVFRSRAAVVAGTPSPNAARLLTAWLISPEAVEIYDDFYMGSQGFSGDPGSELVQRTEALGADLNDTEFFVYESLDNFSDRAAAATRFSELFLG